jgi:hypothetical protein
VFTTHEGRVVLKHILTELGLFDIVQDTEAERARADYAKRLLFILGIWKPESISGVVDALLNLSIKEAR